MYGRIEGTYLKVEITNKLDLYGRISANGYGYESGIGPGRGANGASMFIFILFISYYLKSVN